MHIFDGMSITIKNSGKVSVGLRFITFCRADRCPDSFAQVDVFGKFKVFACKHSLGFSVVHIMCQLRQLQVITDLPWIILCSRTTCIACSDEVPLTIYLGLCGSSAAFLLGMHHLDARQQQRQQHQTFSAYC